MAALAMEFFFCVFILFASQAFSESDCEFTVTHSMTNVRYDLNNLKNFGGGAYNVKDSARSNGSPGIHTYWFNFCGNIDPPMDMCKQTIGTMTNFWPTKWTNKTDCKPEVPGDCAAPVFQTFIHTDPEKQSENGCYRLASKFSPGQKPQATFYDPKDPSKGVVLEYLGGDQCGLSQDGKKRFRKFKINVLCDGDDDGANIPDDEPIFEKPICEYALTIRTQFGCPIACGTINGQLCGGNGECGFDKNSQTPRCFCKSGFYGLTCTDTTIWVPADTAAIATLAVFILGLVTTIAVFTVLVWRRVKSLRLDPEAYSSMGGEMNMKTEDMSDDEEEEDFDKMEASANPTPDEDI